MNRKIEQKIHRHGWLFLCIFLFFIMLPVPAAAEETEVVRVGWYEDAYHITGENGERSGYGYEYEQAVAAYTGWKYEYVEGEWSELLEMLKNGEIDMMGALSYTDDRAEYMLFSELPMGEEKYYLYADLAHTDISASDLSTLNGKRIDMIKNGIQEMQYTEWEKEHNIKTQHVYTETFEEGIEKAANREFDGVISTETPQWVEFGMSAIATTGGSSIYYGINKNRPDLKEKLDNAMRKMENDKPFYADELYKKYLSAASSPVLASEEKEWVDEHGEIRIGYLKNDSGFSSMDSEIGGPVGVVNDYVNFATDCLGKQALKFKLIGFDSVSDQMRALKDDKIDMIFHFSQNPYVAEQNDFVLSNTVLSVSMAAVTGQNYFNENAENCVAVEKGNLLLKWHISYNYPKWKIVEYDSFKEAEQAVRDGKADCFLTESGELDKYIDNGKLHSVFLTQPEEVSFAVNLGNTHLLSILNKTLEAMQSSMLTGALSMYDNALKKVTAIDFIKDNLLVVTTIFILLFAVILAVILNLLKKAKIAEEKAKEAQVQAENANAAKSTFLFNMSHDIRTPMNAILGFTTLAEKNPEDQQLVKEYLGKIQTSGQGLLSILDKVLELSRIESGKTTLEETPQEAGKVFDTCLVMMNPEIEKRHHTIIATKEIQYPYVYFDAPRMTEIILNILSNSVKYTADGGKIHCALKQFPHPEAGWIYHEFSVTDSGIGMSKEFQKHIFENFSRERSTTLSGVQGTGLGMGIVKKLVDLMGGTIEVKSKLGEGSSVSVKIPVRVASFEETQPKHSTESAGKDTLYGKRILLAEDNDLNAEIAMELLREEGLQADRAVDGVHCVERIEKCPDGYYSLILMDIQMPNLDGYQATEKIRKLQDKEKAGIPIIAMTANAFSEDRAKALAAGMNDHVAKPVDMDILIAAMLKYL